MIKTPLLIAAAALFALSACQSQPEEVSATAPDPMASQLANAAPIELPPAIAASVTMRCKDNTLVSVDFYQGDTQARIKGDQVGAGTLLKAPAPGEPFVADGGFKITGNAKTATVETPQQGVRTCRA